MNRLLATTALGLMLGLTPAMAQQDAPADTNANPPAAMPEQPADAPAMQMEPGGPSDLDSTAPPSIEPDRSTEAPMAIEPKTDKSAKTDSDATLAGSPQFLNEQQSNDWLASQLIGQSVVNANNESIGEINDLVTDPDGKVVAALIGVGGFLGLGEKDVAVSFDDLKLARDENNDVTAMLNSSKDALASAPDYKTLDEQEVVQGAAGSDAEKPSGGY